MRHLLLPIALCAACADPNDDPSEDGGLAWAPCPLFVEGHEGLGAQCAEVALPLRHAEPEGELITVFVQRRLGSSATRGRQLWMLPGGPGQSAAVYETHARDLDGALPDTDLYLFEHRGVGRSTRLSCPDQEAEGSAGGIDVTAEEWPDCLAAAQAEWGDGLAAFSIDEAARDLRALIDRLRGEQQVFVYGGSYGTTLAHRFLQHFPDAVDGVILDSLALDVDHRVYDAEFDEVGALLLDACAADARCAEALGEDPHAAARAVLSRVEAGHCADAIDPDTLRAGAGAFLADPSLRGFAPSLFVRAGRCDADDAADLSRLVSIFVDRPPHYTERLYSPLLFANIELSEQWPEPWPTIDEIDAAHEAALFSFGLGPAQRPLLDLWPRYPLDPVAGGLAETDTPILMLQGGLDPQTPPWRAEGARAHFTAPGQHFVAFPEGAHVLLGATPAPGGDCATRLLAAFLDDPLASPDTACVAEVEPIRFTGQPLPSALLFTDCSRYGNGCGGRGQDAALLALGLWWALRRRPTPPAR